MLKIYMEEREGRIKGRREKRKMARVARKRRQVLRYTFLCALLFGGIAGFIKVSWSVADPETDIKVSGNEVVTAKQVRKVLMGCMQKPIYTLNPKELEAKVQSLADVQRAFIRRYIFPRPYLDVIVMEEFPWASYATAPDQPISAVISQTGRMIPIDQFPNIPQPALKIYGLADSKFSDHDVAQWSNCVNFISAQIGRPVDYIDMRKANDIQVQSGDLRLRIGSADSMMQKRIARLPSVLPVLAGLKKENIEYVDLSLDSNVPLKISKFSKKEELSKPGSSDQRPIAQRSTPPAM
jgi:cell division septal protein FtsQ